MTSGAAGRWVLDSVHLGVTDVEIAAAAASADRVAIDCPFGWPDEWVSLLVAHRDHTELPSDADTESKDWRRSKVYRRTDKVVQARKDLDVPVLSVSADKLAHTAVRVIGLLTRLGQSGVEVDRSGLGGKVVEVYPAASLNVWQLPHTSYKGTEDSAEVQRGLILEGLKDATAGWLDLGEHEAALQDSDDALDALVAALTGLAHLKGAVTLPDEIQQAAAQTEGWITLPRRQLADLSGSSLRSVPAAARPSVPASRRLGAAR